MRKGWKKLNLESLGKVGRGKSRHRPRNADFLYGNEYPFIQTADIKAANYRITSYSQMYSEEGLKQSKLWPINTLCITIAANIADSAILGIEACFPDSVIGFIPDDDKSDVRFVKYLFDLLQVRIKQISQGAAQDNLSMEKLRTIKFDVPPIKTQRKIASILSAYDDLIENNLKRIKLLEEQAQQTYEEWFVRFKFPGCEDVEFDEVSGLPVGWEMRELGDVIVNFDSKRIPVSRMKREKMQGKYPYYGAASIMDYVDDYIFNGRYVLMGEDGTVITNDGYPKLQFVEGKFWVNNHAHVLEGTNISNEFLYLFLNQYPIQSHITGVAQPKINQQNLNRIKIIYSSEKVSKNFNEIIKPLFDLGFNLQNQNQLLKEARDILLPRLMGGMINVEDLGVKDEVKRYVVDDYLEMEGKLNKVAEEQLEYKIKR